MREPEGAFVGWLGGLEGGVARLRPKVRSGERRCLRALCAQTGLRLKPWLGMPIRRLFAARCDSFSAVGACRACETSSRHRHASVQRSSAFKDHAMAALSSAASSRLGAPRGRVSLG